MKCLVVIRVVIVVTAIVTAKNCWRHVAQRDEYNLFFIWHKTCYHAQSCSYNYTLQIFVRGNRQSLPDQKVIFVKDTFGLEM